ncbi:MAG: DUF4861 family protein, partial [Prolixibacteraceae bacterium]|nr:DUF4861 family protein [Prolixibacteraceae bacterium]
MKPTFVLLIVLMIGFSACQQKKDQLSLQVKNPLDKDCKNIITEINNQKILDQVRTYNYFMISDGKNSIPYQVFTNSEGIEKILVLCDFAKDEIKTLNIEPSENQVKFEARTQAEISIKEGGKWVWVTKDNGNEQWEYQGGTWKNVTELEVPEQHTDHSFDIRYEGPGWESDKIG